MQGLHHIDLRLRRDPEFSRVQIMDDLFAKIHRELARTQREDIGIIFPGYVRNPASLGDVLRMIGPEAALAPFADGRWLQGLRDFVSQTPLRPVPDGAAPIAVRRRQAKSSADRLRRRYAKRHDVSLEQASERIPDAAARTLDLPALQLRSASTGQAFRLFIEQSGPLTAIQEGRFNAYGLSQIATLPGF